MLRWPVRLVVEVVVVAEVVLAVVVLEVVVLEDVERGWGLSLVRARMGLDCGF